MSKKKNEEQLPDEETILQDQEAAQQEVADEPEIEIIDTPADEDPLKTALAAQEDKFLRLAAEYDNFRKRSVKEKEAAWIQSKADVVSAFLPVYDNLERALKQETADAAYKKGVEMIMTQLQEVLEKMGVSAIDAMGEPFNPELHNAVMHVGDENFGESTVCEVFQTGFTLGEKVIRFSVVKVAN